MCKKDRDCRAWMPLSLFAELGGNIGLDLPDEILEFLDRFGFNLTTWMRIEIDKEQGMIYFSQGNPWPADLSRGDAPY
jgi:hypothetical protein